MRIFTLRCEKDTHAAALFDAVSCIFESASTRCMVDASVAERPVGTCHQRGKEQRRRLEEVREVGRSFEIAGDRNLPQSPKC